MRYIIIVPSCSVIYDVFNKNLLLWLTFSWSEAPALIGDMVGPPPGREPSAAGTPGCGGRGPTTGKGAAPIHTTTEIDEFNLIHTILLLLTFQSENNKFVWLVNCICPWPSISNIYMFQPHLNSTSLVHFRLDFSIECNILVRHARLLLEISICSQSQSKRPSCQTHGSVQRKSWYSAWNRRMKRRLQLLLLRDGFRFSVRLTMKFSMMSLWKCWNDFMFT